MLTPPASGVKSFEDLFVWKKSRELINLIYSYTFSPRFAKDYGLTDQIRRASVSVMSNIAEGFERGGKDEFLYFLFIAKGSCAEVRSQLYVAFDQGYLNDRELKQGIELTKYISALLTKFINGLKNSKHKGLRFKKPKDREQEEFEEYVRSKLPPDHPLLKQ